MTSFDCCVGFLDTGTPAGAISEILGYSCYVAKPKTKSTAAIIISTDIFGWEIPNIRLIADHFASNGFLCVIPHLFLPPLFPADILGEHSRRIHSLPTEEALEVPEFQNLIKLLPEFKKVNDFPILIRKTEEIIGQLKVEYGIQKVGMIGYCWGGNVVLSMGQNPSSIDACVANHPSALTFPDHIEKLKVPSCFILPEFDRSIGKAEVDLITNVLKSKDFKTKVKYYPNMFHGFAVRGDEKDPEVKEARQDALNIAVQFFKDTLLEN
ncbi:dienelactone hydrolase [Globomyces pollinis-pini]|nr:dienelactone hydrolase [Globomyces pollinis-pini]